MHVNGYFFREDWWHAPSAGYLLHPDSERTIVNLSDLSQHLPLHSSSKEPYCTRDSDENGHDRGARQSCERFDHVFGGMTLTHIFRFRVNAINTQ
jgi:hypothetical protein